MLVLGITTHFVLVYGQDEKSPDTTAFAFWGWSRKERAWVDLYLIFVFGSTVPIGALGSNML